MRSWWSLLGFRPERAAIKKSVVKKGGMAAFSALVQIFLAVGPARITPRWRVLIYLSRIAYAPNPFPWDKCYSGEVQINYEYGVLDSTQNQIHPLFIDSGL